MRTAIAITVMSLAACGGSKKQPPPPPPVVEKKEEKPAEPPPPPEPEKPKHMAAKSGLKPIKGAKVEPGTVTFEQDAGADTKVTSEFSGLKAGTYHLVIHDGSECGDDGKKAGGPWKGGDAVKLTFKAGKNQPGNIEQDGVKLMVGGDAPIVGQTLALHADKKGAPGAMLACGTIDEVKNE